MSSFEIKSVETGGAGAPIQKKNPSDFLKQG